uniref:Putative secreted protein n=1 Tax=Ixodes ricinus TaxID=34613 RepID=A0A6B0U939_IXORI
MDWLGLAALLEYSRVLPLGDAMLRYVSYFFFHLAARHQHHHYYNFTLFPSIPSRIRHIRPTFQSPCCGPGFVPFNLVMTTLAWTSCPHLFCRRDVSLRSAESTRP